MITYFIALVVALAFGFGCQVFDDIMTLRGISKGLAVEGFTFLISSKPTALQIYLRDGLLMVACTVPSLTACFLGDDAAALGCLVAPVVYGIKHIQGGLEWRKLGA